MWGELSRKKEFIYQTTIMLFKKSKKKHMKWIIIMMFSLLLVPLFNACNSKGTTTDSVNVLITKTTLKNLTIALELYKKEFGEYPRTLDELLMRKGITERSIIEDAWGRPLHYVKISNSYALFSAGRDKKPFTKDDVLPSQ